MLAHSDSGFFVALEADSGFRPCGLNDRAWGRWRVYSAFCASGRTRRPRLYFDLSWATRHLLEDGPGFGGGIGGFGDGAAYYDVGCAGGDGLRLE